MRPVYASILLLVGCDLGAVVDDEGATDKATDDCPAAGLDHTALEWSDAEVGSHTEATLNLTNDCDGEGDLSVTGELSGDAFSISDLSWTVSPGSSVAITVGYEPDDGTADAGSLLLSTNDENRPDIAVTLSGIPLADDDNDGSPATEDCDDSDPAVYPGATDVPYDGVDGDCDGRSDYDQDQDGFDSAGFGGDDCDDTTAATYPGATDTPYDGIDADCAEDDDNDADSDGYASSLFGGDDCDDFEITTYPGAYDAWYDGADSNCDGASDYDADSDGHDAIIFGGDDCNDADAGVNPDESDAWYDGEDTDCAGNDDYDKDADGQDDDRYGGTDCNDSEASIYLGASDSWYDGIDSDCAGNDDYDQDDDGQALVDYGGTDCVDTDSTIYDGAMEIWYDGVDGDCGGENDDDQDGDGDEKLGLGGDDCDDTNPAIYAGATDTWYDGVDSDCAGNDDFDKDADGHSSSAYGGDDCNDASVNVHPGAYDAWYDGLDADCAGNSDYDKDGDSDDAVAYGGGDCDDTDDTVASVISEVWYDGIDSDCGGDDDYDQDGDGHQVFPTGDDCNDTDATSTTSGSGEVENGLDDDCDGLIDEDFMTPGDVVITEVMVNPNAVSDTAGEWFEVYNARATTVDMNGWIIYSDDGNSMTIGSSLPITPGDYVVLGVEGDTTLNGGVTVDYEYARSSFSFSDTSDSIYIVIGSTTVAELSFSSSSWPITVAGRSMALDDDHYDTSDSNTAGYWCRATETLSAGDYGSPGANHGNCYIDDDGDGAANSDCDDDDASRGYLSTETSNSIDDDCNGLVDETVFSATVVPRVFGAAAYAYMNYAGVADFDGDGKLEMAAYYESTDTAYFMQSDTYSTWAGGLPSAYDEASFTTAASAQTITGVPDVQEDVTGDGKPDFIYTNTYSSAYGFSLHAGAFTGSATAVAADYRFAVTESGSTSGYRVQEGFDFDGDGSDEIIYSNTSSNTDTYSNSGALALIETASLAAAMTYTNATLVLTGGSANRNWTNKAAYGDINDDGYDDVVAYASGGTPTIYTWLGDGFATTGKNAITTLATASITGINPSYLQLEDADEDGTLDLVTSQNIKTYWYYDIGDFSGTTASPTADAVYDPDDYNGSYWYTLGPVNLPYDADGDGATELCIAGSSFFSDYSYAWFGPDALADGVVTGDEADMAFTLPVQYQTGGVYDLDGDSDDEVVIGNYTYSPTSYANAGGLFVVEP